MRNVPHDVAENEVHITSILVQIKPAHSGSVSGLIAKIPGAEIHSDITDGKLVVFLEAKSLQQITERIDHIAAQPGVISAVLVYHQVEDGDRLDDLIDVDSAVIDVAPIHEGQS
ncbi:MAG: chaperone NapD [Stappiaceae bacterium]